MAVLDGWLHICGGSYYGATDPLIDCKKFDLKLNSGTWIAALDLPQKRQHFQMLTYNSSIYVLGGQDFGVGGNRCIGTIHELNNVSNVWTPKSNLPYPNHRFCSVADVEDGKIWMIGGSEIGVGDKMQVYYFTVFSNVWTYHSDLFNKQTVIDPACGIIYRRTGEKILLVVRGGLGQAVIYFDLTNNLGWTFGSSLYGNYAQNFMRMITLTPYNAFIMGGTSGRYGISLRNIFEFNHDKTNFEDNNYYLQNEMHNSYWTMVNKSYNYKALQDCTSTTREYAAVCWGGENGTASYSNAWSVLLQSRTRVGDPHVPSTCHRKILSLPSGRSWHGVTAIDYKLIVCGGKMYGNVYDNLCFTLNTNQYSPRWYTMSKMPIARGEFVLTSYGDVAFAVGGWNNDYISRVDRWTESKGWEMVASYPTGISRFCAVADKGYDTLYVLGGVQTGGYSYGGVYAYKVSTNVWTPMPSLFTARYDTACSIIRRRTTGNDCTDWWWIFINTVF